MPKHLTPEEQAQFDKAMQQRREAQAVLNTLNSRARTRKGRAKEK